MTIKELLSNVPQAFNYLEVYNEAQLKEKVHIWHDEQMINLFNSMDREVIDFNLNGENWTLSIYVK